MIPEGPGLDVVREWEFLRECPAAQSPRATEQAAKLEPWCLMFCHIHKCAPTCYKTQQAMEAYLCRFRYYQVVLVRMLEKPTETENIVAREAVKGCSRNRRRHAQVTWSFQAGDCDFEALLFATGRKNLSVEDLRRAAVKKVQGRADLTRAAAPNVGVWQRLMTSGDRGDQRTWADAIAGNM